MTIEERHFAAQFKELVKVSSKIAPFVVEQSFKDEDGWSLCSPRLVAKIREFLVTVRPDHRSTLLTILVTDLHANGVKIKPANLLKPTNVH